MPGGLDEQVRDRIVAETRGNPLALLELPRWPTGRARRWLRAPRRPGAVQPGRAELPAPGAIASAGDPTAFARRCGRGRRRGGRGRAGRGGAGNRQRRHGSRRGRGVDRLRPWRSVPPSSDAVGRVPRGHAARAAAGARGARLGGRSGNGILDRVAWHRAHAAPTRASPPSSTPRPRGLRRAAASPRPPRSSSARPSSARTRRTAARARAGGGAAEARRRSGRSSRAPGRGRDDLAARGARPRPRRAAARLDRLRPDAQVTSPSCSASRRGLEPLDPERRETHLEALWDSRSRRRPVRVPRESSRLPRRRRSPAGQQPAARDRPPLEAGRRRRATDARV